MRLLPCAAAALVLLAHAASAQVPLLGSEGVVVVGGYTGPGDIVSGATAWYGLRAYSRAIVTAGTQALVNLRRLSDSHTCDIIVSATGGLGNTNNCSTSGDDGTAVATWLSGTSGYATELYDQTGNGNNATQSTTAYQPQLLLSGCSSDSLPCLNFPTHAGNQNLAATITAVSQPYSMSHVSVRASFSSAVYGVVDTYTGAAGSNCDYSNAGNEARIVQSESFTAAETDGDWNAIQCVFYDAGSATTLNVNGTATTGSAGTGATSTSLMLGNQPSAAPTGERELTGSLAEAGLWPVAFSSAQQTKLCHNQYLYWGTSTSC
jgi:hypothetical protein